MKKLLSIGASLLLASFGLTVQADTKTSTVVEPGVTPAQIQQAHHYINDFFASRSVFTVSEWLYDSKDVTVVKVASSQGQFLLTFFGDKRQFFSDHHPSYFDAKRGEVVNLGTKLLYQKLKQQESDFVVQKSSKERERIYAIVSPSCPHCHHAIDKTQEFLDKGVSIVYVPFINFNSPNESLKVSYILKQPADKRFAVLKLPAEKVPNDKQASPLALRITDELYTFNINSFPVFISESGRSSRGFATVSKVLNDLKILK